MSRGTCISGGEVKASTIISKSGTLGAKGLAHEGEVIRAPDLNITSANPMNAYRARGQVNNSPALFVLDTGAAVTLLKKEVWDRVAQYIGAMDGAKIGWSGR